MVNNDFIMAACQTCHGRDLAVVMAIYRFTWGYRKQSAPLSLKTLAKYTKLDKGNMSRILQELIERKIVKVYKEADKRKARHIGINDLSEWAEGLILRPDEIALHEIAQGIDAVEVQADALVVVPPQEVKTNNPTKEECIEYAKFLNQSEKFGELFYLKMEGQGWLNGAEKKIHNWKAYMERYVRNEEMYNNLMGQKNGQGKTSFNGRGNAEGVEFDKYEELYRRSKR